MSYGYGLEVLRSSKARRSRTGWVHDQFTVVLECLCCKKRMEEEEEVGRG